MHLTMHGLQLNAVSLFSGIGGIDFGLEKAGHKIILQCEKDEAAQTILKLRFPGVELADDIKNLKKLPPKTDVVVAGFPCIDISRAGKRQGLAGEHSGLVKDVFRLLERAQDDGHTVPWVLLENVEGILDSSQSRDPPIKEVVTKLEELGYSWAYRVVSSAGFGLPNARRRVFILASMHGDPRDVLLAQGRAPCLGGCGSGPQSIDETVSSGLSCYECWLGIERSQDQTALAMDLGNARSQPATCDQV